MDEHRDLILDGTKINWHFERVAAWEKGERIAPITIDMALSNRVDKTLTKGGPDKEDEFSGNKASSTSFFILKIISVSFFSTKKTGFLFF